MSVAAALYDNHTGELIDAVMPDILAALERPWHPDADALMDRARTHVYESFRQSEISDEAAEWVFKVLVGFGIGFEEPLTPDTAPPESLFVDMLREKYPEVEPFVERMLSELWANRGKGDQAGWRSMTLRQAWGEIAWHNAKMATAIKAQDWTLVRELAADVANGAMMLDDIVATLDREAVQDPTTEGPQ